MGPSSRSYFNSLMRLCYLPGFPVSMPNISSQGQLTYTPCRFRVSHRDPSYHNLTTYLPVWHGIVLRDIQVRKSSGNQLAYLISPTTTAMSRLHPDWAFQANCLIPCDVLGIRTSLVGSASDLPLPRAHRPGKAWQGCCACALATEPAS